MNEQEQQLLLEIADDELILGWRDSEWTGIAPLLEEDVAFSSIAQNEIGHARALYELVARERGTTADDLALDRSPDEFEFQMLYGVRPDEQRRLVGLGYTVRVYVPFGTEWYGYLMRRLAERPANVGFFVRALVSKD